MNRIGKVSLSLTAISVITIGLALGVFFPWGNLHALGQGESGSMENINEERSYDLDDIKNLDISVSSAEIRINVVNSNKLKVHLHGSTNGQKPFLDDKKSGSSLKIEVKRKSNFGFSRSNLILDIDLPKKYEHTLTMDSSSGDISISDLELEELKIDMSSGDLIIDELKVGKFIFDSSSGELTAKRLESSESRLDLSSGSVTIDKFAGNLDAKLSSGDIEISYSNFNDNITVDSSSGDISITLPSDANFELDSETSSGKIICDYPITISGGQDRDQLKGIVGNGGNRIHVEASSGDISILKK
jgi:lia operon protein LiaG